MATRKNPVAEIGETSVVTPVAAKPVIDFTDDAAALGKFITETGDLYLTVQERVHEAVIRSILWAAVHGEVTHLNRIYNYLNSNDQQAVKLYVRLYNAELGLGHRPDIADDPVAISAAVKSATFLKHTSKETDKLKAGWHVLTGKAKERKAWVKLINSRLREPDGKKDRMVLARNNFEQANVLNNVKAIQAIVTAANRVLEPSEKTDTSKVSKNVLDFLAKIKSDADTFLAAAKTQGTELLN